MGISIKLIIFVISALCHFRISWADYLGNIGLLSCNPKTGAFLVKLNEVVKIEHGLLPLGLKTKYADECEFNDGTKVKVDVDSTQAFPYGEGGADPDSFFTLNYKGKQLYYKDIFYQGYGTGIYNINVLILNGNQLRQCVIPGQQRYSTLDESAIQQISAKDCINVSERLKGGGAGYTNEEKLVVKKELLVTLMEKKLSSWCKDFRKNYNFNHNNNNRRIGSNGKYVELVNDDNSESNGTYVDLANNGKISKIFLVFGDNHYFDGSYLIVIPKANAKTSFVLDYKTMDMLAESMDNDDIFIGKPKELNKLKANFISVSVGNASYRYIHNNVVSFDNKNYIYSWATNHDTIPYALLSTVLPNNKLKTLCEFTSDD